MRSRTVIAILILGLTACGGGNKPPAGGSVSGLVISPGAVGGGAAAKPLGVRTDLHNALHDAIPEQIVPGEVIVKFRSGIAPQSIMPLSVGATVLEAVRPLAVERARLYRSASLGAAQTASLAAHLAQRGDIEYAVPNRIFHALATPNDALYGAQWHYPAMNLPAAWDITTGSGSTVVAVIDTGYLPHPDLTGKFISTGYNFISDANSGGPRGPDAIDTGDSETAGGQSSYHGTHVTGTVAAATNNTEGVAGVNWAAKILPVRVLGKGGGTTADIIDGIVWASGGSVNGVPNNPNPAQVINMSLGGKGACDPASQDAIDTANANGTIVVVAAGNDNADASGYSPASCQRVITVGATGPTGQRAPYSNFGSRIDVMAPGGDTSQTFSVQGKTYPAGVLSTLKDDASGQFVYAFYQGTSMASPHVAGLVSLMKGKTPGLTYAQALAQLKGSAAALSTAQCNRPSAADCGAGLVNAAKALGSAVSPTPPPPPTSSINAYVIAFFCTTASCLDAGNNLAVDINRSVAIKVQQTSERQPYSLSGLPAATYLMAAFQDLNGSGGYQTGDPLGVYPVALPITSASQLTSINIQLQAVTATGASSTGWTSGVSRLLVTQPVRARALP